MSQSPDTSTLQDGPTMQTPVHWQLFRRVPPPDSNESQAGRTELPASTGNLAPANSQFFECTFEDAVDALSKLPGMFIEMDGSFVMRSRATDDQDWQIDGMIYDRELEVMPAGTRESRVHWCDIRGRFPSEVWTSVCDCFATPIKEFVIYDVTAQTYLAPSELFAK